MRAVLRSNTCDCWRWSPTSNGRFSATRGPYPGCLPDSERYAFTQDPRSDTIAPMDLSNWVEEAESLLRLDGVWPDQDDVRARKPGRFSMRYFFGFICLT